MPLGVTISPRENQRDRKAQEKQNDDKAKRPVRQIPGRKSSRSQLDNTRQQ